MQEIETILEKVKDEVKDNLQTKLTAIQTEKNDGITLTAPQTPYYFIHEIETIDQVDNGAVLVLPDRTDVIIPGIAYNEDDHNIVIVTVVIGEEGDITKCAKRAYRFARAIREIILDNPTLDDTVISFHATRQDYSPMMADGHSLLMTIRTDAVVKTHETN